MAVRALVANGEEILNTEVEVVHSLPSVLSVYLPVVGDATGESVKPGTHILLSVSGTGYLEVLNNKGQLVASVGSLGRLYAVAVDASSQSWITISAVYPEYDVRRFGAKADGSDDAAAISTALTLSLSGATVVLPPSYTFNCIGTITVPAGKTLKGYGATLNFPTNAVGQGVLLGGTGAKVRGVSITGPQFAAFVAGQVGIGAYPPATGLPYLNNSIEDVDISGFGQAAMDLTYLEDFVVRRFKIKSCYSHGISARSCRYGSFKDFHIEGINADGVAGTNAYGISLTKNLGTEAAEPVCHDIDVEKGRFRDIRTWWAVDTHGGWNLRWTDLTFRDVRGCVSITSYNTTAGSERAPLNVLVSGVRGYTSHGSDEVITRANMSCGISVSGDPASGQKATGITLSDFAFDGYGNVLNDVANNNTATVNLQYADQVSITPGTLRNNGSWGYFIRGVTKLDGKLGLVSGLAAAAAVAPSATITYSVNPSDADTLTLNGVVWTFKITPVATTDSLIGANLAATLATLVTNLTASTDGRVSLAAYSTNGTVLTITSKTIGRSLNTLFTVTGSVGVVSGNLAGGALGAAAVQISQISGTSSSGVISDLVADVSAHIAVQMTDDNIALHMRGNRHMGTGPLYDCRGSSNVPQSGCGDIDEIIVGRGTNNPASIAAAGTLSLYLPCPGASGSSIGILATDRFWAGLTLSLQPANNYIQVRFDNPSAAAIDLASTQFTALIRKYVGTPPAVS